MNGALMYMTPWIKPEHIILKEVGQGNSPTVGSIYMKGWEHPEGDGKPTSNCRGGAGVAGKRKG